MELKITDPREKIDIVYSSAIHDTPISERFGSTVWRLDQQFSLIFRYNSVLYSMWIDSLFHWDGASVPQIAWTLSGIPPRGKHDIGTLPHDLLYRSSGGKKLVGCSYLLKAESDTNDLGEWTCDRKTADIIMYRLWKQNTNYKAKAMAAYLAVRGFGARHFGGPCPGV